MFWLSDVTVSSIAVHSSLRPFFLYSGLPAKCLKNKVAARHRPAEIPTEEVSLKPVVKISPCRQDIKPHASSIEAGRLGGFTARRGRDCHIEQPCMARPFSDLPSVGLGLSRSSHRAWLTSEVRNDIVALPEQWLVDHLD